MSTSKAVQLISLNSRRVSKDLECLRHRLVFLASLISYAANLSMQPIEPFLGGGGTGGNDGDPQIILLYVPPKLDDFTNIGWAGMGGDFWWDGYVPLFPLFCEISKNRNRSRLFEKRLLGAGGNGLFWNMFDTLFVREPSVNDLIFRSNSSGEGDRPLNMGFSELLLPKVWQDNITGGVVHPLTFLPSKRSPAMKLLKYWNVHHLNKNKRTMIKKFPSKLPSFLKA